MAMDIGIPPEQRKAIAGSLSRLLADTYAARKAWFAKLDIKRILTPDDGQSLKR